MKIGLYCYHTADILTKVLQKCSLSCPLPNISFIFITPSHLILCLHNIDTLKICVRKFDTKILFFDKIIALST